MRYLATLLLLAIPTVSYGQGFRVFNDRDLFTAALGSSARVPSGGWYDPPNGFDIDFVDPIMGLHFLGQGCYATYGREIMSDTYPCWWSSRPTTGTRIAT